MLVAIAHWQGRISPVFDEARDLWVVTVDGGREVGRDRLRLRTRNFLDRVRILCEQDIEVLLCGAISFSLENALEAAGIRVVGFLAGECEPILVSFLNARRHAAAPVRFSTRRRFPRPEPRPGRARPPTSGRGR